MGPDDDARFDEIDRALEEWRQGDCVLGAHYFLFRLDRDKPLSDEAVTAASKGSDTVEAEVRGFMVATQSCDIVRSCRDRPFLEVCPVVEVEREDMDEIRKGRRPAYAYIPGVEDRGLVADLDRVMTVEKAVGNRSRVGRVFGQKLIRTRRRVSCQNHGHGTDRHGKSDRTAAAGSAGDYPRAAGEDCGARSGA